MTFSRRLLPAMPALLALEAVERLGTASAAAGELGLTQGAVSRSLQGLEAQLGVALFIRDKQRLRLTPAGIDYVRQIRSGLALLSQAGRRLQANPGGGALTLAILPAFGVSWLAPRLAGFTRANPGVTINLATRLRPFDLITEGFDAAIHFGRPDLPGMDHLLLMEEVVLPVAAPDLTPLPLPGIEALLTLPLLQIESRPGAWGRYLAQHGLMGQRPAGMVFDQFAAMQQAALHGMGVALLPLFLIRDALAEQRLVPVWPQEGRGLGSYYLVWPRDVPMRPALRAFHDWIQLELCNDAQ